MMVKFLIMLTVVLVVRSLGGHWENLLVLTEWGRATTNYHYIIYSGFHGKKAAKHTALVCFVAFLRWTLLYIHAWFAKGYSE